MTSLTHDAETLLSWGRDVLNAEAEALSNSSQMLGQTFVEAVQTILAAKGRLVISGLGKSGHIGRKLAATFASTGTPSFFLHPSEALHGDLGMVQAGDVVLAIAFGGETRETLEVVRFANRRSIPVIGLTGRKESSLARLSQVVIDGSVTREACPHNLAPTTSTTVALGLGDALAVAIMRARGFEKADFAAVHPDGSLGRQLSLVSQHMRTGVPTLHPNDDFDQVVAVITAHNFGIAGIVDEKSRLLGAVTDGDLRRGLKNAREKIFEKKAKDIMTANPKTISSHKLALDAVKMMEQLRITSLFVVGEAGEVVGLIRMHDLLEAKIV